MFSPNRHGLVSLFLAVGLLGCAQEGRSPAQVGDLASPALDRPAKAARQANRAPNKVLGYDRVRLGMTGAEARQALKRRGALSHCEVFEPDVSECLTYRIGGDAAPAMRVVLNLRDDKVRRIEVHPGLPGDGRNEAFCQMVHDTLLQAVRKNLGESSQKNSSLSKGKSTSTSLWDQGEQHVLVRKVWSSKAGRCEGNLLAFADTPLDPLPNSFVRRMAKAEAQLAPGPEAGAEVIGREPAMVSSTCDATRESQIWNERLAEIRAELQARESGNLPVLREKLGRIAAYGGNTAAAKKQVAQILSAAGQLNDSDRKQIETEVATFLKDLAGPTEWACLRRTFVLASIRGRLRENQENWTKIMTGLDRELAEIAK